MANIPSQYTFGAKPLMVSGLFMRPSVIPLPEGMLDGQIPVTFRAEPFGFKRTDNITQYAYTLRPGPTSVFEMGTASGGIVLLPPEIFTPDASDTVLSETHLVVSRGVFFSAATPSSEGAVCNGYCWNQDTSFNLLFKRLNVTGVKTDAVRFTQGGLIAFKAATSFWGTFAHAITADRTWTFPDKSGTVALLSDVAAPILAITTKTANYTVTATDNVVLCDATAASFTITLPTAVGIAGKTYTIKKILPVAAANTVTVDAAGAETIDGALTQVVSKQYDAITVISDNASWWVL